MSPSLHLEDFSPGQTFTTEPVRLSADDLRAFAAVSGDFHPAHLPGGGVSDAEVMGHGPWGLARYFGTVHAAGILEETLVGLLSSEWHYRRPLRVGDSYRWETLVTGWRRTSDPRRGVLHRDVRVLDQDDEVVQEGSLAAMVRAANPHGHDDPPSALPLGLPWARALVHELEDHAAFHDATQLFDGTIGVQSPAAGVQLRIYKGQVIDTAVRTPAGATFTVNGSARAWCELLLAERNDFVVRANRGEFSVTGDAYAYLQLTKALHLIIDAGRRIAATGALR